MCVSLSVFLCVNGVRWDTELCSCPTVSPSLFSPLHSVPEMNRGKKHRGEDKFLQGALSQPVVPSTALQQCRRAQPGKDKLKNAAVPMRSLPSPVSLSPLFLYVCISPPFLSFFSLSFAESPVIIQQCRAQAERRAGRTRQSCSGVEVQTGPLLQRQRQQQTGQ